MKRRPYPSDVSDEALFRGVSRVEWAFVMPYLTLLHLDAAQRKYDLREVFNTPSFYKCVGAWGSYKTHPLQGWDTWTPPRPPPADIAW